MHIPDSLAPLFDNGTIERVVRPLMSGKEAQVYLVVSRGELCVAKVYKEAHQRNFKNRAEYTEGRKTRNTRDQRAIEKRSKHGKSQDEAAWRSTEVDMIHRLHAGGVRVPTPHAFIDGVLVMECVADAEGNPAPRLGDLSFEPEAARAMYDRVLREVVRMLAAGVVHGDLSDFNVLVGADGPVIIDFPQSVDAAGNSNARRLLLRDVENLHRFLQGFVPGAPRIPYAEEMWELFEQAALTAETRLSGKYRPTQRVVSTESVLGLIQDADEDERRRREKLGLRGGPSGPAAPRQPPRVYRSDPRKAMVLTPRNAPEAPAPGPAAPAPPPRPQGARPQEARGPRPQGQGGRPYPPRPQGQGGQGGQGQGGQGQGGRGGRPYEPRPQGQGGRPQDPRPQGPGGQGQGGQGQGGRGGRPYEPRPQGQGGPPQGQRGRPQGHGGQPQDPRPQDPRPQDPRSQDPGVAPRRPNRGGTGDQNR